MIDFISLPKDIFLLKHDYINSLEYDITDNLFYKDIINNVVYMYDEIQKLDIFKDSYTKSLKEFIYMLPNKKQKEIKKIINI